MNKNIEWRYCNYIILWNPSSLTWHREPVLFFSLSHLSRYCIIFLFIFLFPLTFFLTQWTHCNWKQKKSWAYPTKTQSRKQFLTPNIQLLYSKLLDPLTPTIVISHWRQQQIKKRPKRKKKKKNLNSSDWRRK